MLTLMILSRIHLGTVASLSHPSPALVYHLDEVVASYPALFSPLPHSPPTTNHHLKRKVPPAIPMAPSLFNGSPQYSEEAPDLYDVNHGWRTQTELVLALPSHSLSSSPASHPPPWLTVPSGMICESPETCGCSTPGLCPCPPLPGTLSLDVTRQFIQSPAHSEMFPAPHLELSPSSQPPRPPPPTPASSPQ